MSPNTKADGPAGDFVFGDAIIPSGVAGGRAIRAASIRTLVDYSKDFSYIAVPVTFLSGLNSKLFFEFISKQSEFGIPSAEWFLYFCNF